jgi:hypothetical protein
MVFIINLGTLNEISTILKLEKPIVLSPENL